MPLYASHISFAQGSPASAPFSSRSRCILVAVFGALVLLKIPGVLPGRLWAEDGFFLLDALRLSWWQALITPHTGYIDVVASGAMLIATRMTDLEHVPLVSVLIALLIQLCPAVLLVTSRCAWLRPRWTLVTALLLVLIPPISEEIWLSPVTSQYHLMVCAGLILALEVQTGAGGVLRSVLLVLAGLSGPGPALAAPLFIARACVDRSWPRMTQAVLLSAGALIEIAVFWTHPVGRHLGISPSLLLRVIYVKHLLVPFLGPFVLNNLGRTSVLVQWPLLPIMATILAIGGLVSAVLRTRAREIQWLCAAALTMMALSYFGAIGQADLLNIYSGERYYYAPHVLVSLTLLGLARTGPALGRGIASVLVGWLLIVGIREYRSVLPVMAGGPSWVEQVALWRADNQRAITLWPPYFQIRLGPLPSPLAGNQAGLPRP